MIYLLVDDCESFCGSGLITLLTVEEFVAAVKTGRALTGLLCPSESESPTVTQLMTFFRERQLLLLCPTLSTRKLLIFYKGLPPKAFQRSYSEPYLLE